MMSSLHGIRALTNSLGGTLGENTAQLSHTEQQTGEGGEGLAAVTSLQEILLKENNISDLYGRQATRHLPVEVCTILNLFVC